VPPGLLIPLHVLLTAGWRLRTARFQSSLTRWWALSYTALSEFGHSEREIIMSRESKIKLYWINPQFFACGLNFGGRNFFIVTALLQNTIP
jgi:hypothetical protein